MDSLTMDSLTMDSLTMDSLTMDLGARIDVQASAGRHDRHVVAAKLGRERVRYQAVELTAPGELQVAATRDGARLQLECLILELHVGGDLLQTAQRGGRDDRPVLDSCGAADARLGERAA